MMYPRRYAVYDTESSGLDLSIDQIVELGVKVVEKDGTSVFKSWILKGDVPSKPEAAAVHGITEEIRFSEGVDPAVVYAEFCEMVKGLPLVGHNLLRFDNILLKRDLVNWMVEAGLSRPHPVHQVVEAIDAGLVVDTAALFKARELKAPRYWYETHEQHANRVLDVKAFGLKFNLKHVCTKLGIDMTDLVAHRVAGDVEAVDRIYKKLVL